MKVDTQTHAVKSVGKSLKETEFTIKNDPFMFEILSDKLYSDKIQALLRELGTNAYDATILAVEQGILKEYKPFEIHLPNGMEPYFSIRDFGPGLSPEDVHKMYTTFGESTKRDSNTMVGCFGLGSKTPFAITNMFTVVSYYNGTQYNFTAFRNEQNIPTIKELPSAPTKEPNGLKVYISTPSPDIYSYREKAQKVYSVYEEQYRPIILNSDVKFENEKFNIKFNVGNVKVQINTTENRYYYFSGCYLVMGNVAYVIDQDKLRINKQNIEKVRIDVPLGSVSFTPSREHLKYDDKTIKFLDDVSKDIDKEIEKEIIKNIEAEPNLLSALAIFTKSSNRIHKNVKHSGRILSYQMKNSEILPKTNVFVDKSYGRKILNNLIELHHTHELNNYKGATVYYCKQDIPRKKIEYRHSNMYSTEILIIKGDKQALIDIGFSLPIIDADSLPEPPKVERRKSQLKKINIMKEGTCTNDIDHWEPADVDDVDDGTYIYCTINRYKVLYNEEYIQPWVFKEVLEELEKLTGKKYKNIYALRPADAKVIDKKDNWISINKIIENNIAKINQQVKEYRLKTAPFSELEEKLFKTYSFKSNTPIGKIQSLYKASKKITKDIELGYLAKVKTFEDNKFRHIINTCRQFYRNMEHSFYRQYDDDTIMHYKLYIDAVNAYYENRSSV